MLEPGRCPIVRTYTPRLGDRAVRCSRKRDHLERYPRDQWHLCAEGGYRASWPHKVHHCHVTHTAETAGGPVRVWCGLEPDGHDDHEGMCGVTPVRWRSGP